MKERPLTKECPPPTFGPISCIRSKFTQMSAHPGVSSKAVLCQNSIEKLVSENRYNYPGIDVFQMVIVSLLVATGNKVQASFLVYHVACTSAYTIVVSPSVYAVSSQRLSV